MKHLARRMKPVEALELLTLHHALGFVRDWSCAVDGGACWGDWAGVMSERFARVVCFEAAGDTAEKLRERFAGVSGVEIRHAALWDATGRGYVAGSKRATARFVSEKPAGAVWGEVALERVDGLGLESLGLLKLDLEGAEVAGLSGARQTIARCRPVIICEILDRNARRYGQRGADVFHLLEGWGYTAAVITQANGVFVPVEAS